VESSDTKSHDTVLSNAKCVCLSWKRKFPRSLFPRHVLSEDWRLISFIGDNGDKLS
jgi:hypothetical protein